MAASFKTKVGARTHGLVWAEVEGLVAVTKLPVLFILLAEDGPLSHPRVLVPRTPPLYEDGMGN